MVKMCYLNVTSCQLRDAFKRTSISFSYLLQDEIHLLHDDRGPVLEALVAR